MFNTEFSLGGYMKAVNLLFVTLLSFSSTVFADKPLYVVKDGKVDKATEKGFKVWDSTREED